MIVSVMFKDKNKVFRGRKYDYKLCEDERVPEVGSIIRMMDADYNYICYGTRVKVTDVSEADRKDLSEIRYVRATLD